MCVCIYIYILVHRGHIGLGISQDLGASPTRAKEGYIGIVEKEMETTVQTVWGSGFPKIRGLPWGSLL